MHYKKLMILVTLHLFCFVPSVYAPDVWLIIHGTFAKDAEWHYPWGDFFITLKRAVGPTAQVHNFVWSGNNSYKARAHAAQECKRYIRSIVKPGDHLHIIGHSHGGNVAIALAQMLEAEQSPLFIESLITLGTPVCYYVHIPPMQRIKTLYNLFSYGDRVQPVVQVFGRVFNDHPKIYNIQLQCNGMSPTHGQMHSVLVAKYLPKLKTLVQKQAHNDLLLQLFDTKKAELRIDANRQQGLKTDKLFTAQVIQCIADSRYGKKYRAPYTIYY